MKIEKNGKKLKIENGKWKVCQTPLYIYTAAQEKAYMLVETL